MCASSKIQCYLQVGVHRQARMPHPEEVCFDRRKVGLLCLREDKILVRYLLIITLATSTQHMSVCKQQYHLKKAKNKTATTRIWGKQENRSTRTRRNASNVAVHCPQALRLRGKPHGVSVLLLVVVVVVVVVVFGHKPNAPR